MSRFSVENGRLAELVAARKTEALAAQDKSTRAAMLRTGDPWRPIAEAIALNGFVIVDGSGKLYRCWGAYGPSWTGELVSALWFTRREDAEAISQTDEDAVFIVPVLDIVKAEMAKQEADEDGPEEPG